MYNVFLNSLYDKNKMEKNHNFEEQLRKYIEEYPEKTQIEIAKHFKCQVKKIVDCIRMYKIPYKYKGNKKPKIKEEDLVNYILLNPNKTEREIGKDLGIDQEIVSRCIIKNNIKRQNFKRKYYTKQAEILLISYMETHPNVTLEEATKELGLDMLELKSNERKSKTNNLQEEKKVKKTDEYVEKIIALALNYHEATPEQNEKAFLKKQRKKVPVRTLLARKKIELLTNGEKEKVKIIDEILARGLEQDGEDR